MTKNRKNGKKKHKMAKASNRRDMHEISAAPKVRERERERKKERKKERERERDSQS